MYKKIRNHFTAFLLLAVIIQACSPLTQTQPVQVSRLSATYIDAPLIRGMAYNQAIQIRVYVAEGPERSYQAIRLELDGNAVQALQKIDVYAMGGTDNNFLRNASLLGSAVTLSASMDIPVSMNLKPGLHYIWISPVLKADADIAREISIRSKALITNNSEQHQISDGGKANFKKRLALALRKAGDEGVNTYRIPGMATTDKGTLISVYDIRYDNSRDLPANIDVGMNRSTDGGKTWEPMKIIMDMGGPQENSGIGDPAVLFDPATKRIWVAALWSKGNRSIAGSEPGLAPDITGQFVLVSSDDDGKTWSRPYSITSQVKDPKWHLYFNGPGNGIAMENGTLVFPSQYWDESKKPGIPHSAIIYSEDQGKTWKSGIGAKSNTTESQVVETTPGTLMLNMRDNRGKYRSIATTKDLGANWLEHHTSYQALPDPVCMASIIKARVRVKGKMQDVLFFSNMASQTTRKDLTIKASLDLGETWLPANELLLDERLSYGYSALSKIDDETIGILYEGEKDLYFMRVPVADIIK
ncbi:MAG: exo-alpha-sialidase [Daejeonella sp.]|uniref:sialidase family protein n=1 Tax=Daejeonella sp. JGW-45 TaxID=3034148 RepID=UPI0023ED170F|nr:sialidase family protein [Daejeonella sp. JGW-45]